MRIEVSTSNAAKNLTRWFATPDPFAKMRDSDKSVDVAQDDDSGLSIFRTAAKYGGAIVYGGRGFW